MLTICGSTIYRPIKIIFKETLRTGLVPSAWKKGNIVPIHKKGEKQVLKKSTTPFHYSQLAGKCFNE